MEQEKVRKIQETLENGVFDKDKAHLDAQYLADFHYEYAKALYLELEVQLGFGREEIDHPNQQYLQFNAEA